MNLPKNIRGIHIFCTTCSQVCSNKQKRCRKYPHLLAKGCEGIKKYQSRIWNPHTRRTNKVKTWDETNVIKVIKLHNDFKQSYKASNYNYKTVSVPRPSVLNNCIILYVDWLQDIDVPEHEKKNLSAKHVKRCALQLKAFVDIAGGSTPIDMINSSHVGRFHDYLLTKKGYKPETYNKYMGTAKAFFAFLIKKHDYKIKSPFQDVRKKYIEKHVEIITEEEFDLLISKVTPENGIRKYKNCDRNLYFDWVVPVLHMARLTGGRKDEIFYLTWDHVQDNYIKVPNFKTNRAKNVNEYRYVPITQDLAELLIQLTGEGYIIAPDYKNRETIKNYITACFNHFWELTGSEKEVTFRHLRKTYITRIRTLLGDKAKALNIHKSDDIQISHYLNQQEIQKELLNVRLF